MEVKYQRPLSSFTYLVMFDLASYTTGVCIWNINKKQPVYTGLLQVSHNTVEPELDLWTLLDHFFQHMWEHGISKTEVLISQEAMPTQVHGGNSTVQTFLALSRSHAILNLYTALNHLNIYDYIGVYPVSTHAYFKKICQLEHDAKVTKVDISNYVQKYFNIQCSTFDESDAVFLAKTLIEYKWNRDIDQLIQVNKKHIKTLKSSAAITLWQQKNLFLTTIKN